MNVVILTGFLGNNPDVKQIEGGSTVCNMSLATNQHWKDKDGQKKQRTDWHRIVCFGSLGETCAKYLRKGSQVAVRGELRCNNWEDEEGNKRTSVEVLAKNVDFLDRKSEDSESKQYENTPEDPTDWGF